MTKKKNKIGILLLGRPFGELNGKLFNSYAALGKAMNEEGFPRYVEGRTLDWDNEPLKWKENTIANRVRDAMLAPSKADKIRNFPAGFWESMERAIEKRLKNSPPLQGEILRYFKAAKKSFLTERERLREGSGLLIPVEPRRSGPKRKTSPQPKIFSQFGLASKAISLIQNPEFAKDMMQLVEQLQMPNPTLVGYAFLLSLNPKTAKELRRKIREHKKHQP